MTKEDETEKEEDDEDKDEGDSHVQEAEIIQRFKITHPHRESDSSKKVPPLNITALQNVKRAGTAANPISTVYRGQPPVRNRVETAHTGRRMVNGGKNFLS